MNCGACGAEIAEKAIVCYRCGAPTAIPVAARTPSPPAVRGRAPWAVIALLLIAGAVAAVTAFREAAGSTAQLLAGFVAALAAVIAVSVVIGRLRQR